MQEYFLSVIFAKRKNGECKKVKWHRLCFRESITSSILNENPPLAAEKKNGKGKKIKFLKTFHSLEPQNQNTHY